jgi:hypothetical protein
MAVRNMVAGDVIHMARMATMVADVSLRELAPAWMSGLAQVTFRPQ